LCLPPAVNSRAPTAGCEQSVSYRLPLGANAYRWAPTPTAGRQCRSPGPSGRLPPVTGAVRRVPSSHRNRRAPSSHRNKLRIRYITAATAAAAGIVITQASPILPATPQRTAENRLVDPTPMIAEVIVWVVEIGAWKANAVVYSTAEETDSATNPRAGSSSMILRPRVRLMRQPPE